MFEPAAPEITYLEVTIDHGRIRTCSSCHRALPATMFSRAIAHPGGLNRSCTDCGRRFTRISRGVHRDDAGLNPLPGQACELCSGLGGQRGLHLDHDYATGRFRGWLCTGCNSALGQLHDDPELCRAAGAYLEARS